MQESKSTTDEVVGMLFESSLFRDFRTVDLRSIARYFRCVRVVNAGSISVTKLDSDGHLVEIALLPTGRVFGEMAVLDGEYRSATCVAAQDCVLLILSRDSLDKMELDVPKTAARVIRTVAVSLSRRLRLADGKLVDHQV